MSKIPVGRTIEAAYSFAFRHFFAVLAIIWFPFVVVAAILAAPAIAMAPAVIHAIETETFDPSLIPGFIGLGLLAWLGFMVAGAMVRVGLMRKALGLTEGRIFLYFSFGAPVWRMLGAMILAAIIIVAIAVASIAVVAVIWGVAHLFLPKHTTILIVGFAGVAAYGWIAYAAVRLTFFLPAVVVAEEEIGLGRAWRLGRGNFWRIVVVAIAIFVPVTIGLGILGLFAGGFIVPPVMGPPVMGPMDAHETMQMLHRRLMTIGPWSGLLNLIYVTLLAGLVSGAIAGAYRALHPPKADAAESPPAEMHPA